MAVTFIELVEPHLEHAEHPNGVPAFQQILSVVRFLASGAYQRDSSENQNHPMSQTCISRYLHRVIIAINALQDQFVTFPSTAEQRQAVSAR